MLPSEEIKDRINLVDLIGEYVPLKKAGVNFRALCPFHQEKTASFMVSPSKQIWHCFGCFPPGQKIKTPFGLHNIEEIDENHYVYSGSGDIRKILATHQRNYEGELVHVKVRKLGGVVSLTADHHLEILRPKTRYYKKTKQFYRRCRYAVSQGKAKNLSEAAEMYGDLLEITAGELQLNDFVFYPINQSVADVQELDLKDYLTKSYTFGPRPPEIPYVVKVTDDFLKLLGYWIAEGSNHRAYIRFSLGNHEEDFAKEISDLIKRIFGIEAKIYRRPKGGKTGLEITACHAYLANIFENLCGKGAQNKHIPFVFQELAPVKQMVLLNAIHKGDGHDFIASRSAKLHRSIATISRVLAEQLVDILLRNGLYPSFRVQKKRKDKLGVNHKESYHLIWSEEANPQHNFLYTEQDCLKYWLLPVREVKKENYFGPVYNLTVEKDHSYVATNFAVANCSLGGDHFEFIKQIERVEFPEALEILASRAGVQLRRPTVEYRKEQDQKKILFEINDLAAKYYAKVLAESSVAEAARLYLLKRGFKPETIQKWQLGYAPDDFHLLENFIVKHGYQRSEAVSAGLLVEKDGKYFDRFRGRIMFPLLDIHGRVVGFTARILDTSGLDLSAMSSRPNGPSREAAPPAKYVNSPETLIYNKSSLIYGLHLAKTEIRSNSEVVVVEGNMDVITSHEAAPAGGRAGFTNVVGSSGTALTARQLETLKRFTQTINFALDVDEAGLKASRRAVELALSLGFNVKITAIPDQLAKDPDELIRKDVQLWQEQVRGAQNFLDFYFGKTFAELDLSSSQDKKQAVSELLPLLSLLPDPIDRTHYLQKLSGKLLLDEKILLDLLNRYSAAKAAGHKFPLSSSQASTSKSKQEILERRVLGLLLKFIHQLREDWQSFAREDFSHPILGEIYQTVLPLSQDENFEMARFLDNYPKLAREIELLVFGIENELATFSEWKLEEIKHQFFWEFRQQALKQKMQQLATRIREAEQVGKLQEAKLLSTEFNNLTKQLSKYHAQKV